MEAPCWPPLDTIPMLPRKASGADLRRLLRHIIPPEMTLEPGTRSSEVRLRPAYLPEDPDGRESRLKRIITTGTDKQPLRGISRVLKRDAEPFYCLTPYELSRGLDRLTAAYSPPPHWNTLFVYHASALREVSAHHAHFKNPRQASQALLGILTLQPIR